MLDLILYPMHLLMDWVFSTVSYGAGAAVIVCLSMGRYRPGLRRRETLKMDVERTGELAYIHEGIRYVYRGWVIMVGVVFWVFVLLGALLYLGLTQTP
jgi:hypothetical protein